MGLLELLGLKRARDKPTNSYEGSDFSYLLVEQPVARMWMSLRRCRPLRFMPVFGYLQKPLLHSLSMYMNEPRLARRSDLTIPYISYFTMNQIQRCLPLSLGKLS